MRDFFRGKCSSSNDRKPRFQWFSTAAVLLSFWLFYAMCLPATEVSYPFVRWPSRFFFTKRTVFLGEIFIWIRIIFVSDMHFLCLKRKDRCFFETATFFVGGSRLTPFFCWIFTPKLRKDEVIQSFWGIPFFFNWGGGFNPPSLDSIKNWMGPYQQTPARN